MFLSRPRRRLAFVLATLLCVGGAAAAPGRPAGPASVAGSPADLTSIVATVNGDVISRGDVRNRRRLFALSAGMPITPELMDRLTPQVTKQLIDEKLRLQEMQRRKIVVSDKDIADAIKTVETRNNMPPGALRQKLTAQGIDMLTLIDQIRVQLGWTRVIRQQLGPQLNPSEADIADREASIKAQTGQMEYRPAEIFIPVDDPAHADEARNFAETAIQQLRAGAPFAVMAAQFSQSQAALEGGDLGWVQPIQVDPEVADLLAQMPVGAISNPVRVAGGYDIVTLRAKRQIGNDPATFITVRQVFLKFATPLDPQAPTEAQRQTLERAKQISASAHSCDEMEAANKAAGNERPADPGEVRLDSVGPPQFRAMLEGLQPNQASQPVVASDGIAVVMVCTRTTKNLGIPTREELGDQIVEQRAELAARQMLRDLRRRATIVMYPNGA
jgi:peptidyl-prolyl cis-trans isomerase SurA